MPEHSSRCTSAPSSSRRLRISSSALPFCLSRSALRFRRRPVLLARSEFYRIPRRCQGFCSSTFFLTFSVVSFACSAKRSPCLPHLSDICLSPAAGRIIYPSPGLSRVRQKLVPRFFSIPIYPAQMPLYSCMEPSLHQLRQDAYWMRTVLKMI